MATVIKASAEANGHDVKFEYAELGEAAHAPQARAAKILAEAEDQAAALRREAEKQGRAVLAEAEQLLEERLARQVESLLPAVNGVVDAVQTAKAQWLAHWERGAIRVATAIAARVIRREVERDPQVTTALVKEALELAAGSAEVHVRMHPDDLAALGGSVERLAGELGRLGDVNLVADASVERGGCRLDTQFGTIDQQFSAQLARIERELT